MAGASGHAFDMKSNCHLVAWGKFVRGAEWICLRHTLYASHSRKSLTLKGLGIAFQWAGFFFVGLGWYLRWGDWPHVAWIQDGEWYEFMPDEDKYPHKKPPLIFNGHEQKVDHGILSD